MPLIAQSTIDAVYERADLQEVIGSVVDLQKSGANLKGCCPFHNEKTPSFNVNPSKGIYKCFGCGKGGNSAVQFLMDKMSLDFPTAIKQLADRYNITIEYEEADEEYEQKQASREQLIRLYSLAQQTYHQTLFNSKSGPEQKYITDRFTAEQIDQWQIGMVGDSWQTIYDIAKSNKYLDEYLEQSGLVKFSDKGKRHYDFFRHRMMIPVHDERGRVIAFTGRVFPHADTDPNGKKLPKYINSPESIIYSKERTLFGLYHAAQHIRAKDRAILCEGNGDVIHMHRIGKTNTVCSMGTAVGQHQLALIKKHSNRILILFDGDAAGLKAIRKTGKAALEAEMDVRVAIIPDQLDPEDFFTDTDQCDAWLEENEQDYIMHRANDLLAHIGKDPAKKRDAIIDICNLLQHLDAVSQEVYISELCGNYKSLQKSVLKQELKGLDIIEKKPEKVFPDGVDANEAEEWGFYENRGCLFFRDGEKWKEGSNFIMKPIFHLLSSEDPKRIFQLQNYRGHQVTIELDMNQLQSISQFKAHIEGKGNYIFRSPFSHLERLKEWLYENTKTCQHIEKLGWQDQGFFAWSNGITTTDDTFIPIDDYGRVTHKDINYYIPAFSLIYIKDRAAYTNERRFRYEDRDVDLSQWMTLFIQVYGTNGIIAICHWMATLFRDIIHNTIESFPLLNLYGQPRTGKNKMCYSLLSLFGEPQSPYNLHNGTKAGLAEHVQEFINGFGAVDEYANDLHPDIIQALKQIYDGIGRTRMKVSQNATRAMKKEQTEVNCGVILMGQEMPTADIALFTRVIFCQFNKTKFTDEETERFDRLKLLEKSGLSHLTALILEHRKHYKKHFYETFKDCQTTFKAQRLEGAMVDGRNALNYSVLMASVRLISQKMDLPLDIDEVQQILIDNMMKQERQCSHSDELGRFWDIIETLFDEEAIREGQHFRINHTGTITTRTGELKFPTCPVLMIKFNPIATQYKIMAKRLGEKALPVDSLKSYLTNRPEFIGVAKAVDFSYYTRDEQGEKVRKKSVSTGYCFRYDDLGVNLVRDEQGMRVESPFDTRYEKEPLPEIGATETVQMF